MDTLAAFDPVDTLPPVTFTSSPTLYRPST
jgi:hypothetical protein